MLGQTQRVMKTNTKTLINHSVIYFIPLFRGVRGVFHKKTPPELEGFLKIFSLKIKLLQQALPHAQSVCRFCLL